MLQYLALWEHIMKIHWKLYWKFTSFMKFLPKSKKKRNGWTKHLITLIIGVSWHKKTWMFTRDFYWTRLMGVVDFRFRFTLCKSLYCNARGSLHQTRSSDQTVFLHPDLTHWQVHVLRCLISASMLFPAKQSTISLQHLNKNSPRRWKHLLTGPFYLK